MRVLILLLSIALIYVGIAAVMYVDAKADQNRKQAPRANYISQQSDEFAYKPSMRELDSITAAYNYSFTIDNAIITKLADSTFSETKKM